jgi:hypothetical protein
MLPPQHDELMAQHEQLNILRKLRTPTASDRRNNDTNIR